MKKFFALLICSIVAVTAIAGTFSSDAKVKIESISASTLSMAAAGAVIVNPEKRNQGVLAKLRDKYGKDRVIAKSFIRMEAYLVNGKAEYEFYHRLLGNESSTEKKLNDQDGFLITDIGIYLLTESTTVPGIGVLQTYPNPIQFPDEVGAIQNAHLEVIYNGHVTAKIGDTTWLPDLPIKDCRIVRTAQQSALATNDSERIAGDGLVPCSPQYFLKGRENNQLKLVIPAHSSQKVESIHGTSGYKTKVVMWLEGFKVTGAGRDA